ncbi:SDR family NAD(P)-dependent oxidoreductase [Croceicoccus pelagius]|uniref:Short chain dehydrogenase n=1 Tax=Croceicoccus pelagius TaxID=1703341 RepID=A0A916YP18_9SPHN|nr:SDR family NAD(P)-dependent oxidoreductase [Croceicoccus pelagius]GGD54423.1 hypothetical protein GCM10010989_30740 [Croceicoccus pelagius]
MQKELLAEKVAIVTGASMGQGAAEAKLFIEEGAKVILADIDPNGEEIAKELGDNALFVHHDVSKEDSWSNLGPVDKLIGPEAGGGDMYEAEIAC